MKSIHVAFSALTAIGTTLAAVTAFGQPEKVLQSSYDQALAGRNVASPALVAAAHAPGSEHFWLTHARKFDGEAGGVAKTSNHEAALPVTLAQIRQGLAATANVPADSVEIVGLQEIPRASVAGTAAAAGTSALLVTARVGAGNEHRPARLQRFVFDLPAGAGSIARAL